MAVRHLDPKRDILLPEFSHDWESLRSIQVAAADAIFNTQDNVLLTEDGCVLISKRQTALIEIPYRTGEEA